MIKVTLVIPIFSKDDEEEKRRHKAVRDWFFEDQKTSEQLQSLGLTRDDFNLMVIGRKMKVRDGNLIIMPDGMVGKGSIVAHAILSTSTLSENYIICIDGDDCLQSQYDKHIQN
jgi:hypothetical protein